MANAKKNWVKSLSDAINMATTIAAAIALGYLGGRWLDTRFDTEPWLSVAGFLLGVATGIKVMWDRTMASGNSYTSKGDDDSSGEK
ncbi:MAG TPA: AtpZ/AtpI family protein [Syntrophomonadaceae bacterium]|nr:AtpZ/AtpI family protein [Syntrophomonadaceae bacterium]HQA06586.1 AtpZ/AtpI family protein [Syntrophomonadaceae bacterium]HQE22340.1 AtpZ/AtpI family protein [Syntrophomonadaceae bacterium]